MTLTGISSIWKGMGNFLTLCNHCEGHQRRNVIRYMHCVPCTRDDQNIWKHQTIQWSRYTNIKYMHTQTHLPQKLPFKLGQRTTIIRSHFVFIAQQMHVPVPVLYVHMYLVYHSPNNHCIHIRNDQYSNHVNQKLKEQ